MWTTRISEAVWMTLLDQKTVEVLLDDGLLVIDRTDDGFITIRFLTRAEAGIRF